MPSYEYITHLKGPLKKEVNNNFKNTIPNYTIKGIIGGGAFANVYLAVDNKTEEKVAIKIPKIQGTFGEDTLRKFKSESDIWRPLAHKNIVRFIRNGKAPLPYIVMEYMEGGNLRDLLNNHELSIAEGKHLMIQILSGLSYAHRMATIHRDIKPENILFTSGGVAKLTDWGIGKFMASTKVTETLGLSKTVSYSAPEQSDPRKYGKVDWQTDIFQIGILFYEMLTGENPIYSDYDAGIINNLLHAEIPPPSSLKAEIPPELDGVVITALERRKEDRWRSGDVMLNELDRAIRGKVIPSGAKTNLREYRTTLRGMLLDGKITRNEAKNLKKERERLGISEEDHNRLEKELREELGFEEKKKTPENDIKASFDELKELYERSKNLGMDVSPFRGRYNKIRWRMRRGKYDKAEELIADLFFELEEKVENAEKILRTRTDDAKGQADNLIDKCFDKGIGIEGELEKYDQGESELNSGKLKDACGIFEGLAKDLRSKVDEADKEKRKRRELLAEFKELSRNEVDIPPPPGLERKIKDSPFDAEGDLAEYRRKIEAERERIGRLKERAEELRGELQEKIKYCRRKDFKVFKGFKGFNRSANEASDLYKSGEYGAAVDGLEGLVSELEGHIEEKKRVKRRKVKVKKRVKRRKVKVKERGRLRKVGDDWVNSIGMKFREIPGKDYYMGKYTVTQKEWKAVMGTTPWGEEVC